jgi:uncharacterized membrane protein
MLIALPLGLWIFSLLCDIIYRTPFGGPAWLTVAFYTLIEGIVGALMAAVPGLIDYSYVKKESNKIKKIGAAHMILNLTVVFLYVINAFIRKNDPASNIGFGLSIAANILLGASGWLGGEMVYVHHVAVEEKESEERRKAA